MEHKGSGYDTPNLPLCHKNYFELKAYGFLKSLICLKAVRSKNSAVINPRLGATPINSQSRDHAQIDIVTNCRVSIYFPKSAFIFPQSHVLSLKRTFLSPCPFPPKLGIQTPSSNPCFELLISGYV